MTTAGERLLHLAGATGSAAALLLAIGAGATTGAALVDHSGLPTGSAAEHLLAKRTAVPPAPTLHHGGASGRGSSRAVRMRTRRDDELLWMAEK